MEIKKKIPVHDRVIRMLIAVGVAVLLWFMVNGNSNIIVTQDFNSIPITLTNVEGLAEKNLVLAEDRNYYLNLRVKGTDKNLREIDTKELAAEVNLSEIDTKGTYDLEIVLKGLSNSVIIDSMNPTTLEIAVDNIITEDREVEILVEGRPTNDLAVISAKSLEKVGIQGSEETISRISKLTGTADASGLQGDSIQYLQVMAYDDAGNRIDGLDFLPNIITAELILGKTKTVGVIPTTTGKPVDGYVVTEIFAEPSNILIGAKQEVLDRIQSITVNPVDVSDQTKTFVRDVSLIPPAGTYFLDGSDKVKVTVNIEGTVEKSVTVDKIRVDNLSPGLVVSKIKDTKVVVKLEGPRNALNTLNPAQVEAFVDCANLGPGEHEVPIQTNLSQALVNSILPEKTTVTIE